MSERPDQEPSTDTTTAEDRRVSISVGQLREWREVIAQAAPFVGHLLPRGQLLGICAEMTGAENAERMDRMSTRLNAYNVWLCGGCNLRTDEKDNGDRICMACGALFDHAGNNITDGDESKRIGRGMTETASEARDG